MEKVTKVSIGGISFTVEDKAYEIIRNYLDTLAVHYRGNANGAEIIEGIESRMAELYIDRGAKTGIISEAMAREVLAIVGKPEEIFSDSDESGDGRQGARPHRKLYRNPDDKKVAGVCSGIAAYFRVDTVWIRIICAVIFVASIFTAKGQWWNPLLPMVLYGILWLAMPLARTTAQKCEMNGESLSYDNIERQVENRKEYESSRSGVGEAFGVIARIFLIFAGLVLAVIGFSGIIALFGAILGFAVAGIAVPAALTSVLSAIGGFPNWVAILIKILGLLVVFLPFVGMLYGGISLLFDFKSPKWKPGLIIFILWIVSLIALVVAGVSTSYKYWKVGDSRASLPIEMTSDTLHVQFESIDQWKDSKVLIKGDRNAFKIFYINLDDKSSPRAAVYPEIDLIRGSDVAEADMSSRYFKNMFELHELSEVMNPSFCRVSGDTLYVTPTLYDREKGFREVDMEIELKVPENVKVLISEPVEHDFDKEISYTNIDNNFLTPFITKDK